MSENHDARPRKPLLWLLPLGLLLVLLIALALRGVVREVLAVPVAYVIWAVNLMLKSVPQAYYWLALIIFGLYVAMRSLRRRRRKVWPGMTREVHVPGAVERWAERVQLVTRGVYSKQRFAYYLGKLILDVLAHDKQLSHRDIEKRVNDGTLDVPPEVRAYINARLHPPTEGRGNLWTRIQTRIRRRLGLLPPTSSPLDCNPAILIDFLEHHLEVSYDDENR